MTIEVVVQIRAGQAADLPFLEAMLFEAFFWDPGVPRPALAAFRENPEFKKLLADWGRPGDRAVLAEEQGSRLGAAWFRLWTPERHSYGFVDARTPELGLAIVSGQRSRGLGRLLLRALIEAARAEGFPALSLSVSPSNFARQLYESEGFRRVGESGTSWILLLTLNPSTDGVPAQRYPIIAGDGRSTEELVEAGHYGYAHSCVTSENFPARRLGARQVREIVLLEFDHEVTSEDAMTAATRLGLERPRYEDALYFGVEYPDVQRERPVVFLHEPWFGFFGRRDVLCLWSNAGRRELGLEGFDDRWDRSYRFAFVSRAEGGRAT